MLHERRVEFGFKMEQNLSAKNAYFHSIIESRRDDSDKAEVKRHSLGPCEYVLLLEVGSTQTGNLARWT
jgi:hypothetical protein